MATERGRIVLVNAVTQAIVVVEEGGDAEVLAAVVTAERDGIGIPPAARAAIEAMKTVGAGEGEVGEECAVCLDGFGERKEEEEVVVKEMPCKHRFHEGCIERWLGLHGSCPVCRFRMPAEEGEERKKGGVGGEEAEERRRMRWRRDMWVAIAIGRRRGEEGGGDEGRHGGER